jgi:predicted nuclease of predicted toxin-antitoxin system
MLFLVDEDLATDIARIGRRFGLDIVSVHENGREEWTDEQQLVQAAFEARCVVTGNRDDFINLTTQFAAEGRPHGGVVIVQKPLRDMGAATIARALVAFNRRHGEAPTEYLLIFLHREDA